MRRQGALEGSIDRWIDILWDVAKVENTESAFLRQLVNFLNKDGMQLQSLVHAWSLVCDVPPDAQWESCAVKQAIRHVNTFRNRFAHVPFPPDRIDRIADALESVTEQLFSIEPAASRHTCADGAINPLTGSLARGQYVLRGSMPPQRSNTDRGNEMMFVFPCKVRDSDVSEEWQATPFTHIDAMTRPYVLTRLKDDKIGAWEYSRFRAEANAVLTLDNAQFLELLPTPKASEYETEEDKEVASRAPEVTHIPVTEPPFPSPTLSRAIPAETFSAAIDAIRNEEFDAAIPFFLRLTEERPFYHIGWLRLGHALREKAMRIRDDDRDLGVDSFQKSIEALSQAQGHSDPEYQAQALYERSKAYYHLGKMDHESTDIRDKAKNDAVEACNLSSDTKYLTWLEYLERSGL